MPKKKTRFPLYISPEVLQKAEQNYRSTGCRSKSEYIERAVQFYNEYHLSNQRNQFLPITLSSMMEGQIKCSENRYMRILFKLAVELAVMNHVLATRCRLDEPELTALRRHCLKEVRQTTDSFTVGHSVEIPEDDF